MFTAGWILWLAAFGVLEAIALVRKARGDTLSEHVWQWFSLKGKKTPKKPHEVAIRYGFLAFWAWLTVHFVTGGIV